MRTRAFDQHVIASYNGHPTKVHFGAFCGWIKNFKWWLDISEMLPEGALSKMDLLDLDHQAGGHSCIAWSAVAMPVAIRPRYIPFASEIVRDFYFAGGGWLDGTYPENLIHFEEYRKRMKSVGLKTDAVFRQMELRFMESVYPFDASDRNLNVFLKYPDEVRQKLEPLLALPEARKNVVMILVAENSD